MRTLLQSRQPLWFLLVLIALSAATAACTIKMPPPGYRSDSRATPVPTSTRSAEPAQPAPDASGAPRALPQSAIPAAGMTSIEVSAKARPAVAQILTKSSVPSGFFFEPVPASGVGSGAVFDQQGYILTNNHVVEDATEVVVSLPDREKTYNARVVGRDPYTDLAVVKIEADSLPVVPLGNSDDLQIGEPVVAIGNALGLEGGPTVTVGVVSALNRSIDEPNGATLHELIQTDAAINPGNSGGPLVNMQGQVIGINTAVATGSSSAPAQGIGFAISINSAKPIVDDLIAYGKVRRPYLGAELATVTPALARQYQHPGRSRGLPRPCREGRPSCPSRSADRRYHSEHRLPADSKRWGSAESAPEPEGRAEGAGRGRARDLPAAPRGHAPGDARRIGIRLTIARWGRGRGDVLPLAAPSWPSLPQWPAHRHGASAPCTTTFLLTVHNLIHAVPTRDGTAIA